MKLSKTNLEKSLALAEMATPGPWTPFDSGPWGGQGAGIAIGDDVDMWPVFDRDTSKGVANSFFVAHHNPEFIKALIQTHLEALELISKLADDEHVYRTTGRNYIGSIPECVEFLSKHGGVE